MSCCDKKLFISQNNFTINNDGLAKGITGVSWYTLENLGTTIVMVDDAIPIYPGNSREYPLVNVACKYGRNPKITFVETSLIEPNPLFGADNTVRKLLVQSITICEADESDWCNNNFR
jgi:hypothetical protein